MDHAGNVEKAILAEMAKPGSPLIERVTRNNQILLHNFKTPVEKTCDCQLIGCRQEFAITMIPNQVLYPKYCNDHRSEFRRDNFLRQFAAPETAYRIEAVRILQVKTGATSPT